ncbi:stage II sporulation protein M [Oscillospiraceae bacterium MB08-C2-2]|nr:stage II sporulation protein M [Oscillospiraceae bacterium MB08-C2-2]
MTRTTMSLSARRRYYTHSLYEYARKNLVVLLLGGLFLLGVVFGTILVKSAESETLQLLFRLFSGFREKRQSANLSQLFVSSLSSSLLFIVVLFVCGFCAISHPVIVALPLFKGLGLGFSTGALYAYYGSRAIGYVSVLVFPSTVVSTVALLLGCREALRLATFFAGAVGRQGNKEASYSLRLYCGRFMVAAALCLGAALIEAGLYFAFANTLALG